MGSKGEFVSRRDLYRHDIIQRFISGKITRSEAARLLQCSTRHVSRLARKVEGAGILGLRHQNTGKAPLNCYSTRYKDEVMSLIKSTYRDYNISHAHELLQSKHDMDVSYRTLLRWCSEEKLVRRAHKRHRNQVRKSRHRLAQEGLLLQMDGSQHFYNGKEEWVLVSAIDDATSRVYYGEFFKSETTLSYMKVLEKIILQVGVPKAVYVDRAGWLGGTKRQEFGQFSRACEELGIQVIYANSAQAKGRIERFWGTVQDRMIPELKTKNIHAMNWATQYFNDVFLKEYWEPQKTVKPRCAESAYKPALKQKELNEILCFKNYRKVSNGHIINWLNKKYLIKNLDSPMRGMTVEIRHYLDGSSAVYHAGRALEIEEFSKCGEYQG